MEMAWRKPEEWSENRDQEIAHTHEITIVGAVSRPRTPLTATYAPVLVHRLVKPQRRQPPIQNKSSADSH